MVETLKKESRSGSDASLKTMVQSSCLLLDSVIDQLETGEREAFHELMSAFLQAKDSAERRDISDAIVEVVQPQAGSAGGISIDELADEETMGALDDLKQLKAKFATTVNSLMAQKNLTQSQLAKAIGVSQPVISSFISGRHKPQPKTLKRLAEALGVQVNVLWPR